MVLGHAVARTGDRCTRPLHGACVIDEGATDFSVDGKPAASDGH
ncbi:MULTISPECIES: PAAR domain-containing protein [Burkholderia]|nr:MULTISPECIES: PAAR domain-containing protein [Burkholderia]